MIACRLTSRALRDLRRAVGIPSGVIPQVEDIIARHLERHSTIEALRPIIDHRENVVVANGHIPADPPLSDEELARLVMLMSDGKLPVIRSFVGLTRALLERMKDKP